MFLNPFFGLPISQALARLKLQRFGDAEHDCSTVLEEHPENGKAFETADSLGVSSEVQCPSWKFWGCLVIDLSILTQANLLLKNHSKSTTQLFDIPMVLHSHCAVRHATAEPMQDLNRASWCLPWR